MLGWYMYLDEPLVICCAHEDLYVICHSIHLRLEA